MSLPWLELSFRCFCDVRRRALSSIFSAANLAETGCRTSARCSCGGIPPQRPGSFLPVVKVLPSTTTGFGRLQAVSAVQGFPNATLALFHLYCTSSCRGEPLCFVLYFLALFTPFCSYVLIFALSPVSLSFICSYLLVFLRLPSRVSLL